MSHYDMDELQSRIQASRGTLIEKYGQLQIDYRNARADVEALQEQVATLEQLLSDAQGMMEKYHGTIASMYGLSYSLRAPILPVIEEWQQRAKAALNEGKYEALQQE